MQPLNDLIVVKQLPVIEEELRRLSKEIDIRTAEAMALVATEDTVKTVKMVRAELNKEFTEVEEQRKAVKRAIMGPYDAFEAVYKECVSDKYRASDNDLKGKINGVEEELKGKKYDDLLRWFDEYRISRGVECASIHTWRPNVTLTVTLAALKKEGRAYIDRIREDLDMIDMQDNKAEILVEYHRYLNVSQAIMAVSERHKAIGAQKRRQAESEALRAAEQEAAAKVEAAIPAPLAPPAEVPVDDDPVMTVSFSVTAKRSMLKALKQYLIDGGYEFE
jgi:hypothetical protein